MKYIQVFFIVKHKVFQNFVIFNMKSGIKISSSSGGQVQGTTTRSFFSEK